MKVLLVSKRTLIYVLIAIGAILLALAVAAFTGNDEDAAEDVKEGSMPARDQSSRTSDVETSAVMGANSSGIGEYELEVFSGLMKELPVYSVSRNDKCIALTIDAAWADDKTAFILETLDKYNVKATFFLCGFWVNEHPEMVKSIADAGHEIGNHSMTHPHMNRLTSSQIADELRSFEEALSKITGKKASLFRAPYGEYNDIVIRTIRENGYEVIQWNIDTIDWKKERSAQTILDTVLTKLNDGAIILCHNNGYKIEQYLPTLIESALAAGYRFVTVSELLLSGNTVIDVNGVQKPL